MSALPPESGHVQCTRRCLLCANSGLMQRNKKKDRLAAVLSISDLRSPTPFASGRLPCSEAVKQTSAASFHQTRLIAANRRVSRVPRYGP